MKAMRWTSGKGTQMTNRRLQKSCERSKCYAQLLTLLFGVLFAVQVAMAQVDQGAITGVVEDSSGAVVPNAQVTVKNTDTGLVLQGTTNGSGFYVFSPLKIGNYTVSVTAKGFQTTRQENLHLDAQQRLSIPIALKLGAVSDTVTVTQAAPLLETQTSSVAQVISSETISSTSAGVSGV